MVEVKWITDTFVADPKENNMSEEKKTYTYEQRQAGGTKLVEALTEAGLKATLVAEKGKTELFDSVRVRVFDKNGVAAADLTINNRGFINLGYRYTDGDQKVTARAIDAAAELQGSEVSEKFIKVKAAPGGGGNFLGQLEAR